MHIYAVLCLDFLFGCFCGIKFETINILTILFGVSFIFLLKLIIFKWKSKTNLHLFLVLIVFVLGLCIGTYHDFKTFYKVYPLYGTDIDVSGKVFESEERNFILDTEYGNIIVYNYTGIGIKEGDIIRATGSFTGFKSAQYNGDFDSRLHYALQGIVGYISCYDVEIKGHDKDFTVWDIGTKVRNSIENNINSAKASQRCKGFVTALLTGNADKLDDNTKNMFKTTGTSHVTAVSGLHVGIFLSFFIFVSISMRKNKFANFLFVLILVVMYTVMIGERASVFRAGIMSVASYALFAVKRRSDPCMNLMIAGILICAVNPYYVTAPGFQMSFLATLGLVMFAEHFKYQTVAVPVIATLFMMPVTLYYYNVISLTTVFANVIVVFLVPIVILMGYIGCFVSPFLYISFAVAELIMIIVEFFASFTFIHFTLPSPGVRQFIMYFILICAAYFFFCKRNIANGFLMMVLVCSIYVGSLLNGHTNEKSVSVKFMSGGNFNMQHIITENGCEIFVDCMNTADDYAVKNNVKNIFAVFITDTSQARREGLEKLCNTNRVKYVLLPEKLREENLKLEKSEVLYYNQDDYEFDIDNIVFKLTEVDNERCLVMQIYNNIIAMPFDRTMSELYGCNVVCVPDRCTDTDLAIKKKVSEYYIHSTYRYDYYDYGTKYITSQEGMINMTFTENSKPEVDIY